MAATSFFGGAFFGGEFFNTATAADVTPSGGYEYARLGLPRRTKADIAKARERYGIPNKEALALAAIAEVAARQAERLELDKQKRFEELHRELLLRNIEWDAKYLEKLNFQRERLIDAEIAYRIKLPRRSEEEVITLLLMAAAVAVS